MCYISQKLCKQRQEMSSPDMSTLRKLAHPNSPQPGNAIMWVYDANSILIKYLMTKA